MSRLTALTEICSFEEFVAAFSNCKHYNFSKDGEGFWADPESNPEVIFIQESNKTFTVLEGFPSEGKTFPDFPSLKEEYQKRFPEVF